MLRHLQAYACQLLIPPCLRIGIYLYFNPLKSELEKKRA